MAIGIEVCVPSRDGRFDDDVLMRAHAACAKAMQVGIGCNLTRIKDPYTVAAARNRGVAGFLTRPEFSHLLFVDDDVLIPSSTLVRLAETAGRQERAIVAGCVPSIRIGEDGSVAPYVQVKPPFRDWLRTWPEGEVEAESVGGGCMLIPAAAFAELEFPWFRWPEVYRPGRGVRATTDDVDFCQRARSLGYKVWAVGDVRCGHRKQLDVACLIGRG